ncbi:MAG TPA: hypothetical protein VGB45_05475 [Abditibacterium sp.]|jgi:hypothetical protein
MIDWEILSAVSSAFSSLAVVMAVIDLKRSQKSERNNFEDALSREYREIMERIPVAALLGRPLDWNQFSETQREEYLSIFYRYFDLCNQQSFLFEKGRISPEVWKEWRDGISSNLRKHAFQEAWKQMKEDLEVLEDFRGLDSIIEEQNAGKTNIRSLP